MDLIQQAASRIDTDRVVELASLFCATPSPGGEEGSLAEVIADVLDRPGIDFHIEDVVAGRPNVIARVAGSGERAPLVLNGHMDASVHPGPWQNDPADPWVTDGRLFGGGVTDMKGALAAMVAAVEAASEWPSLPGDLILHAVMHHDTIGLGAKYALASEGLHRGFGICGEPSGLSIHTGNGGALKFEVKLAGRSAHVSRQEEGVDALEAAVDVYQAIKALAWEFEPCDRLPDLPRLQIGELRAGTAPAAVADTAIVRGDLRTVPGMDRVNVKRAIEEAVSKVCTDAVTSRVRIIAVQKPFLGATDGPFVDALSAAHTKIRGTAPKITNELPGQAFVSDAADMAAAGLETVVYGVGNWHYAPNEWVDTEELADSARVYLAVAASFA